ncbi:hypothetical protein Dsin_017025 [Dipteronia sinensis]|uniref:Transducin family protein / WD-40 repeat family protein n=1 Tax=Dipteronia sinensis TaxID=43782 RepID=A0AAE0AEB0_9ROSI|nr:hypothetical protein Dsin_017025 [Dipteronia sinensis]
MIAKRLFQKAVHHSQQNLKHGSLISADLDFQVAVHYGVPATSSILAFDYVQRLLAIATLDGRIKVVGGDFIEGLLISPKQLPFKNLEFLQNQGFLVSITNDNEIQVWNLESRSLACFLQWESNITAFSVIRGSHFMYVGDEYGLTSVMKYDSDEGKLLQLPYSLSAKSLSEVAGFPLPDDQPVVGVLPQPCSSGNRVLIAYENGLIILWDVSEAQVIFVGGGKDLQLKNGVESPSEADYNLPDDKSEHHLQEKEISALCWASSDGSILAVGYLDGDILFWNTSSAVSSKGQQTGSRNNVVKIELSSAERRIPVIVLHWSSNNESRADSDGRLFIYGGDEIGSEEVLTVLSLQWSSGMESLRCVTRVDLTLTGSFADMILLPSAGATGGTYKAGIFVLSSPGQLHLYDDASLSTLLSQQEKKPTVCAVEYPGLIPIADPVMTVAKFSVLPAGAKSSKVIKLSSLPTVAGGTKWPLTGGVPSQSSVTKDHTLDKVYVAGYQDGSVRIWDATYPALTLISALEGEVQGITVAGSSAPVSNLNFCFLNASLAVGNECGLVRIYNLNGSSEASFYLVTETKHEVHKLPEQKGPQCTAVFSLVNSPVQALEFANSGTKLAVGFECCRVAVLDMSSLSVIFFTDFISGNSSPITSMTWTEIRNTRSHVKHPNHSETIVSVNPTEEVICSLFKNAELNVIDGGTGNMISSRPWHSKEDAVAISMYVIEENAVSGFTSEKLLDQSGEENAAKNEPVPDSTSVENSSYETKRTSSGPACAGERLSDALVLICCEDSLRLYSKKSVIQGNNKTIRKVKLAKPCCWTTTFEKDGKVCGLLLLFQTGVVEIRSLPDLELVKESSLMSILRWNFKANMDKTTSADNGQMTLANGSEVAFIYLLAAENDSRILESLPCLHDKVLAAAADAAFSFSSDQKKKQGTAPGILGGIVKGFKGGKVDHPMDITTPPKSSFNHLEGKFSKPPFSDSSPTDKNYEEAMELNIDDIEIDEAPSMAATSSHVATDMKIEKKTERERLLGAPDNTKPHVRTREEIMAKYRKAEDVTSGAAHARDKLVQRQEKLEVRYPSRIFDLVVASCLFLLCKAARRMDKMINRSVMETVKSYLLKAPVWQLCSQ